MSFQNTHGFDSTIQNAVILDGNSDQAEMSLAIWPKLTAWAFKTELRQSYSLVVTDEYSRPAFQPVPGEYDVVRTDTQVRLGVVSRIYRQQDNQKLYGVFQNVARNLLNDKAMSKISIDDRTSRNGAYCTLGITFRNMRKSVQQLNGTETSLSSYFRLRNAHGGQASVSVASGVIETLSNNVSLFGTTEDMGRHTTGLTQDDIHSFCENQIQSWVAKVDRIKKIAMTPTTDAEVANAYKELGYSPTMREKLMQQFAVEAKNRGKSVWAAYQALSTYASKDCDLFRPRKRSEDNLCETFAKRQDEVCKKVQAKAFLALSA